MVANTTDGNAFFLLGVSDISYTHAWFHHPYPSPDVPGLDTDCFFCVWGSACSLRKPIHVLWCINLLFFWQMAQSQGGETEANKWLAGDQKWKYWWVSVTIHMILLRSVPLVSVFSCGAGNKKHRFLNKGLESCDVMWGNNSAETRTIKIKI